MKSFIHISKCHFISLVLVLASFSAFSQELPCQDEYDTETCKERYHVDSEGRKHGRYILYFNNGSIKASGNFNHGVAQGAFKISSLGIWFYQWYENGEMIANEIFPITSLAHAKKLAAAEKKKEEQKNSKSSGKDFGNISTDESTENIDEANLTDENVAERSFDGETGTNEELRYIKGNSLNIREGAGGGFQVIGKSDKGEVVKLLSNGSKWSYIETEDGLQGYVSSKFLSINYVSKDDLFGSSWIKYLVIVISSFMFIYVIKIVYRLIFRKNSKRNFNKDNRKNILIGSVVHEDSYLSIFDEKGKIIVRTIKNGKLYGYSKHMVVIEMEEALVMYDSRGRRMASSKEVKGELINVIGNGIFTKEGLNSNTYIVENGFCQRFYH
ncbi:SH3 domain-containing protein [Rufibacter quisquiliarum]|uniref:Uncharacterized protein YgiM (DUF1202 family) n=1 Tax=Rufibacter quisquiliarum TaxID=1549639 RepID=A0A839GN18_9BACT|nr:SH3 domain-containing protein [Rufibacter quisquiliarum]MBA9078209.1 uncharacterized protein YgiM (DUF1202 family) [Rufibacter quisquiliarum]